MEWINTSQKKPHDSNPVLAVFTQGDVEHIKILRYLKRDRKWITDDVMPFPFNHPVKFWMETPITPSKFPINEVSLSVPYTKYKNAKSFRSYPKITNNEVLCHICNKKHPLKKIPNQEHIKYIECGTNKYLAAINDRVLLLNEG